MTLQAAIDGLETALLAIEGLRVYPYPTDSIEAPAIVIGHIEDTPFAVTLRGGSWAVTLPLWLFISKASDRAATLEVVPYLEYDGDRSIRQAVEVDRSLGGACDTVALTGATTQIAAVAGIEFFAVEFTLEVIF